jgi:hypothetical protein
MCRPVWVSEACQLFLVPSRNSNTPLHPSKCCELGNVPRLLPLLLSSTWTRIWVFQGVGSASLCVKSYSHTLVGHVTSRWWGGHKMGDVSFHHFYFIYMASMIDDKVTWCPIVIIMIKNDYKSFDMNIDNPTPTPWLPTYLLAYPPNHLPITYLFTYLPTHPFTHLPTYYPLMGRCKLRWFTVCNLMDFL